MKIALSVAVALLFIGCSESTQKETKTVAQAAPVVEQKAPESRGAMSSMMNSANTMASTAHKVATTTADKAQDVADSAVKATNNAVENAKVAVTETADKVADKVDAVVSGKTGQMLFKTCAGCHGQKGEKIALGKSQVIQGWSVVKTSDALNGYKAGTYGGVMKGIMVGQTKKLSENDVELIAEYISTL